MKQYKFSIIYYSIFVLPFLIYALVNLYIYIFTTIPASSKSIDALFAGLMLGMLGAFIVIAESDL